MAAMLNHGLLGGKAASLDRVERYIKENLPGQVPMADLIRSERTSRVKKYGKHLQASAYAMALPHEERFTISG